MKRNLSLLPDYEWHTRMRGPNRDKMLELVTRYEIYLANADDGKGGDITQNGAPLKTFDEWVNS